MTGDFMADTRRQGLEVQEQTARLLASASEQVEQLEGELAEARARRDVLAARLQTIGTLLTEVDAIEQFGIIDPRTDEQDDWGPGASA